MWKKLLPLLPLALLLLLLSAPALARDKTDNWISVRSPHFVVATNSNEKQGRHIAGQFERMRSLFHQLFPKAQLDSGSPIIVLAIRDEKGFRALEPAEYLQKGSLQLGGLFLRAPEKNYVLLRLDAEGEHPYAVVYHEYTHFLMAKFAEFMPLWMNEGLAEFFQNTEFRDKEVLLGEPSRDDILYLRENRLLPLTTLLSVDQKSPYYHEEHKGSVFYAQSWALAHYLMLKAAHDKTDPLQHYLDLTSQNVDPVTAAAKAFGDLGQLQMELQGYINRSSFGYFKRPDSTNVDETTFTAQAITPVEADALRADFLAYNQRIEDSRSLLDRVLEEDANNVSAHETMGYLEFHAGRLDQARDWYAKAVKLDSQSYLAHYYFAAMSMQGGGSEDDPEVEASLRTATRLNPSFAPAFDLLSVDLGMHHRNLDEARMMAVTAVSLDPANVSYRLHVAQILMEAQQPDNAAQVLKAAVKVAKTPEEVDRINQILINASEYSEQMERMKEARARMEEEEKEDQQAHATTSEQADAPIPHLARRDFVAKGPHRFVVGVLKNVRCTSSGMDLAVRTGEKSLALHSDNFYKIPFTALGFQPSGELQPCSDLEGRPAKVEYEESANQSQAARLVSVELHK